MIYTITNKPEAINWQATEYVERTLQNAKNLLCTWMGEVPYDRLRGLDSRMRNANAEVVRNGVRRDVQRALLWEPDVKVVDVRLIQSGDAPYVEVDLRVVQR